MVLFKNKKTFDIFNFHGIHFHRINLSSVKLSQFTTTPPHPPTHTTTTTKLWWLFSVVFLFLRTPPSTSCYMPETFLVISRWWRSMMNKLLLHVIQTLKHLILKQMLDYILNWNELFFESVLIYLNISGIMRTSGKLSRLVIRRWTLP